MRSQLLLADLAGPSSPLSRFTKHKTPLFFPSPYRPARPFSYRSPYRSAYCSPSGGGGDSPIEGNLTKSESLVAAGAGSEKIGKSKVRPKNSPPHPLSPSPPPHFQSLPPRA